MLMPTTNIFLSCFRNQPALMEYLIVKGADRNAANRSKCTPLHVAVNKQHESCVKLLLRTGCNVNWKDSYGDTALHDAIGKENMDIVAALIAVPEVDFMLKNKRGFNVLHHAALKGNNLWVLGSISKIVQYFVFTSWFYLFSARYRRIFF